MLPGIQLVNTRNHGVAFGFLPGDQTLVTLVIVVALLALLVYFALHVTRPLIWLPTGMLIGGALGNILDRLREGSVTDFVKLPLGWPPFNLADTSITLGVLLLLFVLETPREGLLVTDSDRSFRSPTRTIICSSSTKPPAWSCIPRAGIARARSRSCSAPLAAGGEAGRAGIVHRLDRDTSGLLVVSRSDEAHRLLQTALAERRIEREYIALVEGRPPAR